MEDLQCHVTHVSFNVTATVSVYCFISNVDTDQARRFLKNQGGAKCHFQEMRAAVTENHVSLPYSTLFMLLYVRY